MVDKIFASLRLASKKDESRRYSQRALFATRARTSTGTIRGTGTYYSTVRIASRSSSSFQSECWGLLYFEFRLWQGYDSMDTRTCISLQSACYVVKIYRLIGRRNNLRPSIITKNYPQNPQQTTKEYRQLVFSH